MRTSRISATRSKTKRRTRNAKRDGVMDDLRSTRLRYNAAFDAHRAVAAENARRCLEGDPITIDELILERCAADELNVARRALFAALDRYTRAH